MRTTFWHDFESEEENPQSGSFIFNGNLCGKKIIVSRRKGARVFPSICSLFGESCKYTIARFWSQGVLTAVLSAVMGSKDPDQVSIMAKQAGEVVHTFFLSKNFAHSSCIKKALIKYYIWGELDLSVGVCDSSSSTSSSPSSTP